MIILKQKNIPTHIKIDVDGAEKLVINGAKVLLSNKTVKDIFIEIDHKNMELKETILNFGFDVVWEKGDEHRHIVPREITYYLLFYVISSSLS